MAESKRQMLTIGVFFIILVVAILLLATNVITLGLIVPLILGLFGLWILVMTVMRGATPMKYERSAFSTMAMGVDLIVLGAAWYLFSFNWLYSLALILLALGAIAIASAMRKK
jgi:hypothetical protein